MHQNTAHHLSRHGKEMRAILPIYVGDVHEPEIGFVDERSGL
jgi:hypothetical protein